jgi:hypothetical protein
VFVNLLDAEVAAEQVKLALEAICLEERKAAVGLGDGALRERRGSPHPPSTRSGQASTLRDGAKEPRLLRMTGKGRWPLALRDGSPVFSLVCPEEARRAVSKG